MTVSLVIWVLTGALIGASFGMAFKQGKVQFIGSVLLGAFCGVAGGWLMTFFGLQIGGPYIGAAVNAAIGSVVAPLIILLLGALDIV